MKDKFNKIPVALQKQIILRFGMGILVFFLFIIVSIYYRNLYFSLPCFLLSFVLFAYGIFLFYNCIENKYLMLEGTCVEVLTKRVRKKIKSIILMVDGKNLKLPIQKRVQTIKEGDTVTVYLSENAPVYEDDGNYIIYSYYALEVRKEYEHEYRKRENIQNP